MVLFKKICNFLFKIVFPSKCILCEKIIEDEDTLCQNCWEKIKFIEKPYCNKCSSPLEFKISNDDLCLLCLKNNPLYIKSRSAVVYNSAVSKIIFKFKFYDKIHIKRFMSKCIISSSLDILENVDILIPVPLHKKRLIFRKYNQSLMLANEIAKMANKIVIYDFLIKKKHTIPQAKLKKAEREENLKNSFFINEKYLKNIKNFQNKTFAIVDDVITTGATMNECLLIMKQFNLTSVYCLSFAKTVRS